jgi:hypothetical protein
VNYLRNVLLSSLETSHYILADADFLPSSSIEDML